MIQVGSLGKLSYACSFTLAVLFQGCSTQSHDMTAHQVKVNQDLANSWRRHGDEKVASSFEDRNRKIVEDDVDNYGLADFLIDVVLGD
ncbi:hypothetical protein [Marinobacter sp. PE14]